MPELRLEWTTDGGGTESVVVAEECMVLGRREDCDVVLPHGFISGHHCRIRRLGDEVEVEDLGSTNGTNVDGRPVQKGRARPGDTIELGSLTLRVVGGSEWVDGTAELDGAIEEERFEELTTMFGGASEGTGNLEKLTALLEFQLHWRERFSPPDLFRAILRHALELSHAERAFVLVRGEEDFDFAAGLDEGGRPLSEASFRTSRSVVRRVSETREPVFMTEGITGELAHEESIMAMELRAVACLPLLHADGGGEVTGILYLDSTRPMHRLSGLDERILGGLAVEASRVIERVQLLGEREERDRIERELELARQTQEELLPRELPASERWRVRAWCRPTRHVGGDLYDFVDHGSDRMTGLLADVSGKGIAASLLSSSVQGAMQAWLRSEIPLGASVGRLNDYLCERTPDDRFVTLFAFDLDAEGEGTYVNAGHLPAFVFRASDRRVDWLDERDPVSGAFEGLPFHEHSLLLGPGDLLLVYSDGVTEAFDVEGREFGEERLVAVFAEHAAAGVDAVARALDRALAEHLVGTEPGDDVTVVLLQRRG